MNNMTHDARISISQHDLVGVVSNKPVKVCARLLAFVVRVLTKVCQR